MNLFYICQSRYLVSSLAIAVAISQCGCSSSSNPAVNPPASQNCSIQFSGNVNDTITLPANCATLAADPDAGSEIFGGQKRPGNMMLKLSAQSKQILRFDVSIDLGSSPSAGTFTSETVTNWSAQGTPNASNNVTCFYTGGTSSVPNGNFTLALSSVDADAGPPVAHGTLKLELYVQQLEIGNTSDAGPACGIGEQEQVTATF